MRPIISVIIPTYHEEGTIDSTLRRLFSAANSLLSFEVIVVDASKDNETAKKVRKFSHTVTLIRASKGGRALQMNLGASKARGDILLFLHSDTLVPRNWNTLIAQGKRFDYGHFYKIFDHPHWFYQLNAWYTNKRLFLTCFAMGDHGFFVKKSLFDKVKGFPCRKIMEDVEMSKKLCDYTIKIIKKPIITSARRFEKKGKWNTYFLHQKIKLGYFLGFSDKKLVKMYR